MKNKEIIVTDADRNAFSELMENTVMSYGISRLAKAITVDVFRNGPVEDMHAEGKLSQEDMKTLNKYMVNSLARLLYLFENNDFVGLQLFLGFALSCATDWDEPEINLEEVEEMKRLCSIDETIKYLKKNHLYGF